MLVIFDLDGTIADCEHRLHHIRPNPPVDLVTGKKVKRRFDRFEQAIPLDTPIPEVVNIYLRFISDPTVTVILLTGRNEESRYVTEQWLIKHGLTGYDQLYMKPSGKSMMPDKEQKRFAADQIQRDWGKSIAMVFEDRARVVQMWKDLGVFVLNVDQSSVK